MLFTEDEVWDAVRYLPNRKAPGPYGIPNMIVKGAARVNLAKLTRELNVCIREECFPEKWKLSKLELIPNPGHPAKLPPAYRLLDMLNTTAIR